MCKKKRKTNNMPSLILGFCKCNKCGFEKYYWNTYFVCQECGAKGEGSYEKTGYSEELRKQDFGSDDD